MDRFFTSGKLPLALEVGWDRATNPSLDGLGDENFCWACQFLESVGNIDRIADCREIRTAVRSDVTDDHHAGVYSNPQIG